MDIHVYVGGQEIPIASIEEWERGRAAHVNRFLRRKRKLPLIDITVGPHGPKPIEQIREELTQLKVDIGPEALRTMLRGQTALSGRVTKLLLWISRGRHQSSVTEIFLPGISAADLETKYFDLMLNNTQTNLRRGLQANPDHYVLMGHGDSVQEVIEATGGSPVASKFNIYYGVEDGLHSKKDPLFPYQAAGLCCLEDGTPIGGVRHQMRDTDAGTHVRLEVEFPYALPRHMITQHQMHLACEFNRWFTDLLEDKEAELAGGEA